MALENWAILIALTLDTYSHVLLNLQKEAADKLEEAVQLKKPERDPEEQV